jgi:hypothetical protein
LYFSSSANPDDRQRRIVDVNTARPELRNPAFVRWISIALEAGASILVGVATLRLFVG